MIQQSINLDLHKTMRLLPGYDPYATAPDGCYFDERAAEAAIAFFPERLVHVEGALAGSPFLLEPWQQAIVGNLFGWQMQDTKGRVVRRYREAFVFVPRKNGKTPLAAGIALYCLFCDPERGQQNYIAASTREQAGLLFRHCKGMILGNPDLEAACTVYGGNAAGGQAQSIVRESMSSFCKIISADSKVGQHGKNLNLAIIDELHEQPDRNTYDTLHTSMASANKPQPLMIYTTTSDFERPESICNEIEDRARKIRAGLIDDPRFLPVIYAANKDDDWRLPETWRKANPNLGVSVSADYLVDECKRAQESPAIENLFKRLHLNIRTEQAERLLPVEKWDACLADEWPDLRNRQCWCGLDLGSTGDFTAFVPVFPIDGLCYVYPIFWIPEASANRRREKLGAQYLAWERAGALRMTPGNEVDYDRVAADIVEFSQQHSIQEIAADRLFQGAGICQSLREKHGLPVVEHGQGFLSMAVPTRQFLEAVGGGTLRHDGNPVLRWMVSNLTGRQDEAGNWKPDKKRSGEKIDGVVATIMGLGRATAGGQTNIDYYERHEVRAL